MRCCLYHQDKRSVLSKAVLDQAEGRWGAIAYKSYTGKCAVAFLQCVTQLHRDIQKRFSSHIQITPAHRRFPEAFSINIKSSQTSSHCVKPTKLPALKTLSVAKITEELVWVQNEPQTLIEKQSEPVIKLTHKSWRLMDEEEVADEGSHHSWLRAAAVKKPKTQIKEHKRTGKVDRNTVVRG